MDEPPYENDVRIGDLSAWPGMRLIESLHSSSHVTSPVNTSFSMQQLIKPFFTDNTKNMQNENSGFRFTIVTRYSTIAFQSTTIGGAGGLTTSASKKAKFLLLLL